MDARSGDALCGVFQELSGYLEERIGAMQRGGLPARTDRHCGSCLCLSTLCGDQGTSGGSGQPDGGHGESACRSLEETPETVRLRLQKLIAPKKPSKTTLQDAVGVDALLDAAAEYLRWRIQAKRLRAHLSAVASSVFSAPEFTRLSRGDAAIRRLQGERTEATELLEEAASKLGIIARDAPSAQASPEAARDIFLARSSQQPDEPEADPERKQSVEHRSPETR